MKLMIQSILILANLLLVAGLAGCGTDTTNQEITTAYGISVADIPQKEDIDSIRVFVVVSGDTVSTNLYTAGEIEDDLLTFIIDSPADASVTVLYSIYSGPNAVAAGNYSFLSGEYPTIPNPSLPPVVDAGADTLVYRGQEADFNGQVEKRESDITSYSWDFDGDGEVDAESSMNRGFDFTYADTGLYTAYFYATGALSLTTRDSMQVQVKNPPPKIESFSVPSRITVGDIAELEVIATSAYGQITFYEWDLNGDGTWDSTGSSMDYLEHRFLTADPVTVIVRITDTDSNYTYDTTEVDVRARAGNLAPEIDALIQSDTVVSIKDSVGFRVDFSDGNTRADVISFKWDFDGDGEYDVSNANPDSVVAYYETAGVYTIKVLITDAGGESDSTTTTVNVVQGMPTVTLEGSETGRIGEAISFTANANDDNGNAAPGSIVTYEWDLDGDGVFEDTTTSSSNSFTYPDDYDSHTYTPTVRITDDDDNVVSADASITISNRAPEITDIQASQDTVIIQKAAVLQVNDSAFTDADNNQVDSIYWTFSDGATSKARGADDTIQVVRNTLQTLTVTATVKDKWGAMDSVSVEILVRDGFIDVRDGQWYMKTTIGAQTWMAENLNYSGDDGAGNKTYDIGWCYGVAESDTSIHTDSTTCDTYGRLYTWDMVMDGATSSDANPSGVLGICPEGWHVPSDAEWTILSDHVIANSAGTSTGDIGPFLKSTTGWNSGGNGTDAFGFSGLPGGYRNYNGSYINVGDNGYWWSSTESSSSNAYYRHLGYGNGLFIRSNYSKSYARSVRCIMD